jgi:hypothetical protein
MGLDVVGVERGGEDDDEGGNDGGDGDDDDGEDGDERCDGESDGDGDGDGDGAGSEDGGDGEEEMDSPTTPISLPSEWAGWLLGSGAVSLFSLLAVVYRTLVSLSCAPYAVESLSM